MIEDPKNDGDGGTGDADSNLGDAMADDDDIVSPLIPDAGEDGGDGAGGDGDDGGIPDSPEAYELPVVDGLDADQLKASPIVGAFRNAAHKAGIPQAAFNEAIADYAERAQAQMKEQTDIEVKALGDNAKGRIAALNSALGQRLPTALAQALAASINTAKGIEAIEQLLASGRRTTGTPQSAAPVKSRADIEKMMADKRYTGKPQDRDPQFIAEIDKWWQDQAKIKK